MKILFLSFYYPPDLSAGSFRSEALVNALLKNSSKNTHIDMITTMPNRYNSFSRQASKIFVDEKITVTRVSLPSHKSGIYDQAKSFLVYALNVIRLAKNRDYDLVIATSSRLMTAVLGALLARRIKAPLYLDLRDIFVDTINDIFPKFGIWAVSPLFSLLERWVISYAAVINLVSEGFLPYFKKRYPKSTFKIYTNGIDDVFIGRNFKASVPNPIIRTVLYAGNIGLGQGLDAIIPELACEFAESLHFIIIGDGGRREQLIAAVNSKGCKNVEIIPPVDRDKLFELYCSADILFLHLNNFDAFKKVLPSKIFEYAAVGKPIWAGISGYSAEFVRCNIDNCSVFEPCNVKAAIKALNKLDLVVSSRDDFIMKYSRSSIMNQMALDILKYKTYLMP